MTYKQRLLKEIEGVSEEQAKKLINIVKGICGDKEKEKGRNGRSSVSIISELKEE